MTTQQLFGRPSWSILGGLVPLLLIALIIGIVAVLPVKPNEMAYVGLAWMLFIPIMVLFGIGLFGSIAAFFLSLHEKRGLIWPIILLLLNGWPLMRMAWLSLFH